MMPLETVEPLRALARFLVSLDQPEGVCARRVTNLGDICARARTALSASATPPATSVGLDDLFVPIVGWAVLLADGTVRDVEMSARPDEQTWADMTYCIPEGAVVKALHFGAPATERENRLREALGHVSRWCHGIAAKAKAQGNFPLEATTPRIAEEIGRALAGEPLAYAELTPSAETDEVMAWLREHGQTS